MAYERYHREGAFIIVRKSVDSGASWNFIGNNIEKDIRQEETHLIAAFGEQVYLVWEDTWDSEIFLRMSTDGLATWRSVVNLSNNAGGSVNPQFGM